MKNEVAVSSGLQKITIASGELICNPSHETFTWPRDEERNVVKDDCVLTHYAGVAFSHIIGMGKGHIKLLARHQVVLGNPKNCRATGSGMFLRNRQLTGPIGS